MGRGRAGGARAVAAALCCAAAWLAASVPAAASATAEAGLRRAWLDLAAGAANSAPAPFDRGGATLARVLPGLRERRAPHRFGPSAAAPLALSPCSSPLGAACRASDTVATASASESLPLSKSLRLPAFDSLLGRLVRVDVRVSAPAAGRFQVENLDPVQGCVGGMFSLNAQLTCTFDDASLDLASIPFQVAFSFGPLAPFDGVLDYDGPSGETHPFAGRPAVSSCFDDPLLLAYFVAAAPGDWVTFTVTSTPAFPHESTTCGSLDTAHELLVGVALEVTYTYCR